MAPKKNGKKLTLTTKASKQNGISNGSSHKQDDENSLSTIESSTDEVIIVKSQSPPWKETFDYIADQAFNVAGAAYLSAMMAGAVYYVRTQTDVDFSYEFQSALRLMMFHNNGIFFGMLVGLIVLRWFINRFMYPLVLERIYEGKNHKFTAQYCEWLFDAIS